jgi:hypothetical protein
MLHKLRNRKRSSKPQWLIHSGLLSKRHECVAKNELDFTPTLSPGAFVEQPSNPGNERGKLIRNEATFLSKKLAAMGGNNQAKSLCQAVPEEVWQFEILRLVRLFSPFTLLQGSPVESGGTFAILTQHKPPNQHMCS